MAELAREEVASLSAEIERVAQLLKVLLLPKDPMDERTIMLEARELFVRTAFIRIKLEAVWRTHTTHDPGSMMWASPQIRAGTGGDEAALFAADLLRMYQRYADGQSWKVAHLSESVGETGGLKEVIVQACSPHSLCSLYCHLITHYASAVLPPECCRVIWTPPLCAASAQSPTHMHALLLLAGCCRV